MRTVEDAPVGRPTAQVSFVDDSRVLLQLFLLALFAVVLVRTAWVCDDAYITLRTVDNLIAGYGPRWNVTERVQSYTHPLWMLLLAAPYSFTHEAYFTSLALSMTLSVAAVWLFLSRLATSATTAAIGAAVLILSKAFVDYSTSGLENPLTHFLLAVFLVLYWRQRGWRTLFLLWLLAGLIMLARLDLGLLVVPAVLARSSGAGWRRGLEAAALGLAPVIGWELFSLVYYGFPFPNTAYAKLGTGVGAGALVGQGLLYLLDSIAHDPVTVLAIAVTAVASVRASPREHWPFALGIALYGAYIVRIGGDFMSGRFWAAPVFCAVATFAHLRWRFPRGAVPTLLAVLTVLGVFATTRPPVTSGPTTFLRAPEQAIASSGISDERAFYYGDTGLLRWSRDLPLPHTVAATRGRELRTAPQVITYGQVGLLGYYAGPQVHVIDQYGLSDPLLARLPAQANWRIGHYSRTLPNGYVETIRTGHNVIADVDVAARYERLKLITQGPVWSRRRWRAIVAMNLGG